MIRSIIYSLLICVFTIAIILFIPFNIVKSKVGPSPYQPRIEELLERGKQGLHPSSPEIGELDLLIIKNNSWFDQKESPKGFANVLNQKSSSLSPIFFILWLVSFYIIFRKNVNYNSLTFLILPFMITLYGLFSWLTFFLMFSGVILGYILLKFNSRSKD